MSLIWTSEVEALCENLRINSVNLSEYHRRRYYHFKAYGKYFRLPMIILASVNSTASVGLQPILDQAIISGITCFIGMLMGIIGAIELYMGIQTSMELELKQSKEFYSLAIDLYKTLSLRRENRSEHGKDYLNKKYGVYTKLCEASNLLKRKLKIDLLTTIPEEYEDKTRTPTPIEQVRHQQQLQAMNEFMETKTCCERMCMFTCCCFYDEDNFSKKNLQLYNFPNHRREYMNHSTFHLDTEPSVQDIENQQVILEKSDNNELLIEDEIMKNIEEEEEEQLEENEL